MSHRAFSFGLRPCLRRPVVLELSGGVGNLLFQYTAARTLERQAGVPVFLSRAKPQLGERLARWVTDPLPAAPRWYDWATFGEIDGDPALVRRGLRLVRRFNPRFRGYEAADSVMPSDPCWRPAVHRLMGYFQHPSWYLPPLDDVASQVATKTDPAFAGDDRPYVGVHLRRGDYVSSQWALDPSWYPAALRQTRASDGWPVFVVGDDPLAVMGLEAQLRAEGFAVAPDRHGAAGTGNSARADFATLTHAYDLVMSNSTFAWWAAVVGDHRVVEGDRRVVMPHRWFGRFSPEPYRLRDWIIV